MSTVANRSEDWDIPIDDDTIDDIPNISTTNDIDKHVSKHPGMWNEFFGATNTEFRHKCGNPNSSISKLHDRYWDFDAEDSGDVSEQNLLARVELSLEKSGGVHPGYADLLQETVRRRFAQIDLRQNGVAGLDEWTHFMLLRLTAPSHIAARCLNQKLRNALKSDPAILNRIHTAFAEADVAGSGLITREHWNPAIEKICPRPGPPVVDFDGDGLVTYYEFVSYALGTVTTTVELVLYDLSGGLARLVPSQALLGHSFEGIWHAGVRVFGKEWWYGGGVFASEFGNVAEKFGKPVRLISLGSTFRTKEELNEFIIYDLLTRYHPGGYNLLNNNCVCFANEVVQFLLHGRQVPQEVLMQPAWLQNSMIYKSLFPLINTFCDELDDPNSSFRFHADCHDMTDEWRGRVRQGDLALHRKRFIDVPLVVKVRSAETQGGTRLASVVYLQPKCMPLNSKKTIAFDDGVDGIWEWTWMAREDVPVSELYPCYTDALAPQLVLHAATGMESNACEVLSRSKSVPGAPICLHGHIMEKVALPLLTVAFSSPPPCNICGESRGHLAPDGTLERLCCTKCSFDVCEPCLKVGMRLGGCGVFNDVLTRSMAADLLKHFSWQKYKAKQYFFMASLSEESPLGKEEFNRILSRMLVELDRKSEAFEAKINTFVDRHMPESGLIDCKLFEAIFCHIMSHATSGPDVRRSSI